MALTNSIIWNTFEVPTAYKSVQSFDSLKQETTFKVKVHCNVWKDNTKELCLYGEDSEVIVPYNGGEVSIAEIYTELKKQDQNIGWTNC